MPHESTGQRRATVMLIQRGDPEIGGALMQGVIAGRAGATDRPADDTTAFRAETVDAVEIVTVEQDERQRVARLVRIAVGNTRTAEDYRQLIVKARGDYAVHARRTPMRDAAGKLLLAWAMLWEALRRAYRAQEKVLRP